MSHSNRHKIGHLKDVLQASLLAWYAKTKPNTTKAHIHQSKEINVLQHKHKLEMWANAQRDGHPAEYRWHPVFNDAKFG